MNVTLQGCINGHGDNAATVLLLLEVGFNCWEAAAKAHGKDAGDALNYKFTEFFSCLFLKNVDIFLTYSLWAISNYKEQIEYWFLLLLVYTGKSTIKSKGGA